MIGHPLSSNRRGCRAVEACYNPTAMSYEPDDNAIERTLNSRLNHIESELSRLRSVVYLLVKDRPELLRLLGQEPPPS